MTALPTGSTNADPGSFRDPRSRVFVDETGVRRGLSEEGAADFEAVVDTGFFKDALAKGDIVDTWPSDQALAGWAATLGHARIPVVSYPSEWTFSMLRDAAVLQLRLLRDGLVDGVLCKDGTAYNVQFEGHHPRFIDVGSFQPMVSGPWPGYRQFCQTFLYPLLLQAYLGEPFQPFLRGAVDGIAPATANRLLHGRARLRRGVLLHVALHARAERRYGGRSREVVGSLSAAGGSVSMVDGLARRLERLITELETPHRATEWSDYSARSHYPAAALQAKERFVTEALSRRRWRLVHDLGCNDGRFSRLAASHADHVVASDIDDAVVDTLYRSLSSAPDGPVNITTLVIDAADPTPALGWRHRERSSLADRLRPDLVLCLALVHHLAVGRGIPLTEVVDYLASMGASLVVEVPHADDPMVQTLAGGRRVKHDYDVVLFERLARERFVVTRQEVLPGLPRTLFELQLH